MRKDRRAVITGIGVVCPLGTGARKAWSALCSGQSGVGPITKFDPSPFKTRIAAEVRDFEPLSFLDKKEAKRLDLFIQYALAAAQMAVEDSALDLKEIDPLRVGVAVGSAIGGIRTIENAARTMSERGHHWMSIFFVPNTMPAMAAGWVASRFGARGPSTCVSTACATGNHNIGDALRIIQRGEADVMIAGGSDAGINALTFGGLDAIKALSIRNDDPQRASRPFDRDRDGFVTGEGAGILILEELEHANARSAGIYAEVIGYGFNNDAYHVTAPDPTGKGPSECMRRALTDAGIAPEDVGYINAHGTATPLNDAAETRAIKLVFGEHSYRLAVSSNKSMIGHMWGGAGAVEAIFTALTLKEGVIPPTINYQTPDPDCDLDYVPNAPRRAAVKYAISNSFGFGGTNATIVLARFDH